MEPQIQYAKTPDGVNLAWYSVGAGFPLLWMSSGPFTNIEYEWRIPETRAILERIAAAGTLIRYDARGFSLSDRDVTDFSLDAMVCDLETIVDACGHERVVVMSPGIMSIPAVVYAARHPERVLALVLTGGIARGADAMDDEYERTLRVARGDWEVATRLLGDTSGLWSLNATVMELQTMLKRSVTQETYVRWFESFPHWDASSILDHVQAPALITRLGGGLLEDRFMSGGRRLAAALPNGKLATTDPMGSDMFQVVAEFLAPILTPETTAPVSTGTPTIAQTSTMERDVQYCTTDDGVSIAYAVSGAGPPLLVCPHFIESFSLDSMMPPYETFIEVLGRNRRLIRYDMRGTGLSDRNAADFSLDALISDLDAVVTAAGAEHVDVWAPLFSVMRAIGYAIRHPQRVRHLVLYQAHEEGAAAIEHMAAAGLAILARADWQTAAHAIAGSGRAPQKLAQGSHAIGEWNRQSASGETFANLIDAMTGTTITDIVHLVSVPTLIIHHRHDAVVNVEAAQRVAARISGSRMRILDGEAPFWTGYEKADRTAEAVVAFLGDEGAAAQTQPGASPFRTVLFTDLVGHTEMMQRLGDAKGREVLREHERITRACLKEHGGVELKTDGDSFMVSFASVASALECAIALQRAFSSHNQSSTEPIAVRMGLNAGEPIEEDGDLFGSSVILAARVAAQAGAGEILIPEPVRHLLAGKPYVYADRGETILKGFEDAARLFEVRWRES